jgi:Ca2+-binding RTX toxin-like protein
MNAIMPLATPRIPIVVLAGQSNANSVQLGVEVFRHVAQNGGMMVHAAYNGSALSERLNTGSGNWNAATASTPMGSNLAALCTQLWSILTPGSPSHVPGAYLESVIWVQGEADAFSATAAAEYGANLRALHATLTGRFGAHDMVLSGLSDAPHDFRSFAGNHAQNWDAIQAQQRAVAAGLGTVHLVNPDQIAANARLSAGDMFRGDFIHYDEATGFAGLLGRSLAQAALHPGISPQSITTGHVTPPPALAGTAGNDSFTVMLSGFGQVMAGPGHDKVTALSGTGSVSLIEVSSASTRIIDQTFGSPRILDLIAVEEVTLGAGHDTVRLGGGIRVVNAGAGNDGVTGFAVAELFRLGRGNDSGFGAAGSDTLWGEDGHDWLWGSDGADMLYGGNGNDTLSGGAGDDLVSGGHGSDVLTGDAGADVFVFSGRGGTDRITDFDPAEDLLHFVGGSRSSVRFTQAGDDVLVVAGLTQVLLDDVALQDFSLHHMVFL